MNFSATRILPALALAVCFGTASGATKKDDRCLAEVVVDTETGAILYGHNEERRFQFASIAKVFLADVIDKEIESGNLDPNQEISTIIHKKNGELKTHAYTCNNDLPKKGQIIQGTVSELLTAMLLKSVNNFAITLGDVVGGFREKIHDQLQALGIKDVDVYEPVGSSSAASCKDVIGRANSGTALGIARFFSQLSDRVKSLMRRDSITISNISFNATSPATKKDIPNATAIAPKTGSAQRNFSIAAMVTGANGEGVVIVVGACKTQKQRKDRFISLATQFPPQQQQAPIAAFGAGTSTPAAL